MDLLLWRHAEAEDGSPDARRRLTARGENQARQVAEWLLAHAPDTLRSTVPEQPEALQTWLQQVERELLQHLHWFELAAPPKDSPSDTSTDKSIPPASTPSDDDAPKRTSVS